MMASWRLRRTRSTASVKKRLWAAVATARWNWVSRLVDSASSVVAAARSAIRPRPRSSAVLARAASPRRRGLDLEPVSDRFLDQAPVPADVRDGRRLDTLSLGGPVTKVRAPARRAVTSPSDSRMRTACCDGRPGHPEHRGEFPLGRQRLTGRQHAQGDLPAKLLGDEHVRPGLLDAGRTAPWSDRQGPLQTPALTRILSHDRATGRRRRGPACARPAGAAGPGDQAAGEVRAGQLRRRAVGAPAAAARACGRLGPRLTRMLRPPGGR